MVVIHLKGLKKATAKGRVYWYHRATGKRLKSEFGTAEFIAEVSALDKFTNNLSVNPRSLGALIEAYKRSPDFQRLAIRTKKDYNYLFNYLQSIHDMPLSQIDTPFILGVRDRAFEAHKRKFANYIVQILGTLFSYGLPRGLITNNPAKGVPVIPRPRGMPKQNRPWSEKEIEVFFDGAPQALRIATALGLYAGMRQGDVVKALKSIYDGHGIHWQQNKTGEDIYLFAPKKLRQELDKAPKDSLYLVCRNDNRPYKQEGFKTVFFRRIKMLQDQKLLGENLTFHGLRHTAAKHLAEAGCDTRDIAAVLGHRTEDMAKMYAESEDKRNRAKAAILKLESKK